MEPICKGCGNPITPSERAVRVDYSLMWTGVELVWTPESYSEHYHEACFGINLKGGSDEVVFKDE